ncbi:MAG: glutamine synthetase family protein [Parvibaculum sp.]|uniref:glutamine synthetase family protein n=1 Tax=Parvibaculum sp. TaxID=2024848 RepID=UPI002725FB02|nr:glutamine synthetase family protein [Parvibaculum sp.]MDO8838467.1 glutamine synthetase family protein [Parvibaculum sp.]
MSDRQNPAPLGRATLGEFNTFLAEYGEIDYLDAIFVDMCGTVRGKRFPSEEADKVFTDGVQMPQSLYFFDVTGVNEDVLGMGFSDGDPDAQSHPVAGSIVPVPWASMKQAQVLMTMVDEDGAPLLLEPRNVLANVVKKLDEIGLRAIAACEFEFYILDKDLDRKGRPQAPINPATGYRETANEVYGITELDGFMGLLKDIDEAAAAQGVPASGATAEFAPGQYEINLKHEDDVLRAGDHAIMLRHLVGAIARRHNFTSSFMAKPFVDQTGNGLHVHCSVVDRQGKNIFDDGTEDGSPMLRHAIGGLQDTLGDAMAFFAPNLNSYRRFGPNLFVPVNRTWGYNNRSVAFRVPNGSPESRRVEHRVSGADANPYLVLAAILAGIHHGIVNKIEPGEPAEGNACEIMDEGIPFFLPSALKRLRNSQVMRNYLGDRYVDVYAETKMLEYDKFQRAISPLEYDWYL